MKDNEDKKKLLALYPDHPRPVTRRDFLATGLIGFSGYVMAPTALAMLLKSHAALADDCPKGMADHIPFFHVEFSGGMSLESAFLMGQDNGDPNGDPRNMMLDDYSRNGWDPRAAGAIATDALGYPMRAASTFYTSMKAVASANALACCATTTFGLFSNADNSNANPFSPSSAIAAIAQGLPIVGNRSSISGTNQPVFKGFPYSSTQITSATTLRDLSAPGNLSRGMLDPIFRAAKRMTSEQAKRLSAIGFDNALAKLMGCSISTAIDKLGAGDANPLTNARYQRILGLTPTGSTTTEDAVLAALIMAVVDTGYVGAGYSIGGCDIHDNTAGRTLEVNGMQKGGRALGAFLQSCYESGKRGVAFLSTDGSAYSASSTGPWQGDLNSATAVMVVIDPTRGPGNTKMKKLMLGGYTDGRTAANEQPFSKNPRMVGEIVAANYYYLMNGSLNGFESIAMSRISDLQPFIVVG